MITKTKVIMITVGLVLIPLIISISSKIEKSEPKTINIIPIALILMRISNYYFEHFFTN